MAHAAHRWVAAPALDLGEEPLTLRVLAQMPIITYARQTAPYQELRDLFASGPPPRLFANASLASMVRLMLDGIGVGVVPPAAIRAELDRGTLRVLPGPALRPLRFTASWREGPGSALAAAVGHLAGTVAAPHGP